MANMCVRPHLPGVARRRATDLRLHSPSRTSSGGSPAGKTTQHDLDDKLKTDVKTRLKAHSERDGSLLRRPGAPRPPNRLRVQRKASDDFKFASWKKDKSPPRCLVWVATASRGADLVFLGSAESRFSAPA